MSRRYVKLDCSSTDGDRSYQLNHEPDFLCGLPEVYLGGKILTIIQDYRIERRSLKWYVVLQSSPPAGTSLTIVYWTDDDHYTFSAKEKVKLIKDAFGFSDEDVRGMLDD